jgi:hypothetical protein
MLHQTQQHTTTTNTAGVPQSSLMGRALAHAFPFWQHTHTQLMSIISTQKHTRHFQVGNTLASSMHAHIHTQQQQMCTHKRISRRHA